jgi:hypothetical protein
MPRKLRLMTSRLLSSLKQFGEHNGVPLLLDPYDGSWYARSDNENRTGAHYYHRAPSKAALLRKLSNQSVPVSVWSVARDYVVPAEILYRQGTTYRFRLADGTLSRSWERFYDLTPDEVKEIQELQNERVRIVRRIGDIVRGSREVTVTNLEEIRERQQRHTSEEGDTQGAENGQ